MKKDNATIQKIIAYLKARIQESGIKNGVYSKQIKTLTTTK